MSIKKLSCSDWISEDTQMNYQFIRQVSFTAEIHCHDFFEIFLITQGKVLHKVNGHTQMLTDGSMVLIRPEDVHFYEAYERDNCQFINLAFTREAMYDVLAYLKEESFSKKLLSGDLPPTVFLSATEKDNARAKLERLTLLSGNDNTLIKLNVKLLLSDFMVNYFYFYHNDRELMPLWLEKVLRESENKEVFSQGTSELEKIAGKTQAYISRMFKKYLGVTPTEYINGLRLNYAANMLIHSNLEIMEIAFEAGFNNLSHFYHLFQKKYGVSPSRFRKTGGKILDF